MFPHQNTHICTCTSPDAKTHNQTDPITTVVWSFTGVNHDTTHSLVFTEKMSVSKQVIQKSWYRDTEFQEAKRCQNHRQPWAWHLQQGCSSGELRLTSAMAIRLGKILQTNALVSERLASRLCPIKQLLIKWKHHLLSQLHIPFLLHIHVLENYKAWGCFLHLQYFKA